MKPRSSNKTTVAIVSSKLSINTSLLNPVKYFAYQKSINLSLKTKQKKKKVKTNYTLIKPCIFSATRIHLFYP